MSSTLGMLLSLSLVSILAVYSVGEIRKRKMMADDRSEQILYWFSLAGLFSITTFLIVVLVHWGPC